MLSKTSIGNPTLNQSIYALYLFIYQSPKSWSAKRCINELWHLREVHKETSSKGLARWE